MKRLILCMTCFIIALAVTPAIAGILDPNPDVDDYGVALSQLTTSFGKGKTDFIRDLLKKAGDQLVNDSETNQYKRQSSFVLMEAAHKATKEEWNLITKYVKSDEQYKIEKTGHYSLLYYAAQNKVAGLEIAKFLVEEKKLDVNAVGKDGLTPIFALFPNIQVIEYLIANGADVNFEHGGVPLHSSCGFGNEQAEKTLLLLKHGANVLATDNSGCMPLNTAIGTGQTKSIPALIAELKKKLPPNADVINTSIGIRTPQAVDPRFPSPLFVAVEMFQPESIKTLIECGANPNVKNNRGETPLHWAVNGPYGVKLPAVLEAFLAGGYDPTLTDASGYTAFDYVSHRPAIQAIFRKYNADIRGPGLQQASLR